MPWLVPFARLTPEQQRAVQLPINGNRAITGPPGSGKSIILVHRADYLRVKHDVEVDRFRLFVYTNALTQYIRADAELVDLPQEAVCTWDSWCCDYYKEHIRARLPWEQSEDRVHPDFVRIRREVREHLIQRKQTLPLFDFVLVDEAQDIDAASFDTMQMISKHVTVAMDQKQKLYQDGTEEEDVLEALGLPRRNVALISAYRCCPHVHDTAACFLQDEVERTEFLGQRYTPTQERETTVFYVGRDYQDESANLIRLVRERVNRNERVAILVPTKRLAWGNAKALQKEGIPAEHQEKADYASDVPKVMTYHSVKGLTFNSVFMPYLSLGRFKGVPTPPEDLLFVGATRAQDWVYMSTSGTQLQELLWLEPQFKRSITVRSYEDAAPPAPPVVTLEDLDIL